MNGLWWKALGALLMLYVLFAGFLIPLKPGVSAVTPATATAGERVTLEVEGYNTSFAEGEPLRAWLRIGAPEGENADAALAAASVTVAGPQRARLTFDLPAALPGGASTARASLIVDDPSDGAYVRPDALVLRGDVTAVGADAAWTDRVTDLTAATATTFPYRALLGETIRNQYYHVSLWFALMILMLAAAVYAARYLITGDAEWDRRSHALTRVGLAFGLLGLVTGMLWARFTWGQAWSGDVKQNMTAVALLIYFAYFVLRSSIPSAQQSARIASAYNVFAFAMLIPLLYVIPRMYESLHPGAGGNPGFGGEDLDNTMRMVFYPGIVGFTLIGAWMAELWWRSERVRVRLERRALSQV